MMTKKPSYTENLIRTPKKRSTYFWARRSFSFILALIIGGWLKLYIGNIGSIIAGTTIFFLVYIFISHYQAIAVMAVEDMMS